MGRSPCCAKEGLNRGAWTAHEDKILTEYIKLHGEGKWRNLPKRAGSFILYLTIYRSIITFMYFFSFHFPLEMQINSTLLWTCFCRFKKMWKKL
jgi:hypothetical protein